ncbi:acyl-CoA acyltransferase [Rhodopseudomonas sp. HC1]|uniref:acyl-CoA acyltransferase n=1 Tax=Rhodopseudomonas infernalis TaxID=2897386 RepID=UPI001EE8A6A6|nr:acyl-CoA acyltransferase [Rhodopseudomonas infernalis]MCG6205613.1 acyl-CoA acyltransferase [Rhodopseudomonas infernalis]
MNAPQVRCREIVEGDIEAVSDLLTRGFSGRTHDYWRSGLHRQRARDIPADCPRYGYLLETEGRPVGVLLLIYAPRGSGLLRCNVSSWYVDPEFRNYATMLTSMAQKNKAVTYVNISPAVNTWPIIEAQGFRRYCAGMFVAVPLLSRAEPGMRVERITGDTGAVAGLPEAEFDLLRSHAGYGCLSLVARVGGQAMPFILLPKRMKHGRYPTPAMQLVYCRDVAEFVRCAGALGRALLWRGAPLVALDANGPIDGLKGLYSDSRGRKYFKGPNPPRLGDLTETELVLYGP